MKLLRLINENVRALKITQQHLDQARGNVHHCIVGIPPEKFLELTTSSDIHLDDIKGRCKTLDDYNKWADEGSNILMPFLYVDGKTGQIKGHEGRHRAAALMCAGGTEIPVSIRIIPSEEHTKKYGVFEVKYNVKFEDLPNYIHGEFGRGIIAKRNLRLMRDGWQSMRDPLTQ